MNTHDKSRQWQTRKQQHTKLCFKTCLPQALSTVHHVFVSAPPTLLIKDSVVTKVAQLGSKTFFLVGIFTQTPPSVNISRLNATHVGQMMDYSLNITHARVNLPVFDQIVGTDGFQCVITFTINTMEEFGKYQLSVTNSEGTTIRHLEIVPEGTLSKTFKDI